MTMTERPPTIYNLAKAATKAGLIKHIQSLNGIFRVKIEKHRMKRSDAQNKILWGHFYPRIANGIKEAWGESLIDDEVHILMKQRFLAKPIVNRETGEEMGRVYPSSAKLNVQQFTEYLNNLTKFAAEYLSTPIPEFDSCNMP